MLYWHQVGHPLLLYRLQGGKYTEPEWGVNTPTAICAAVLCVGTLCGHSVLVTWSVRDPPRQGKTRHSLIIPCSTPRLAKPQDTLVHNLSFACTQE